MMPAATASTSAGVGPAAPGCLLSPLMSLKHRHCVGAGLDLGEDGEVPMANGDAGDHSHSGEAPCCCLMRSSLL